MNHPWAAWSSGTVLPIHFLLILRQIFHKISARVTGSYVGFTTGQIFEGSFSGLSPNVAVK